MSPTPESALPANESVLAPSNTRYMNLSSKTSPSGYISSKLALLANEPLVHKSKPNILAKSALFKTNPCREIIPPFKTKPSR